MTELAPMIVDRHEHIPGASSNVGGRSALAGEVVHSICKLGWVEFDLVLDAADDAYHQYHYVEPREFTNARLLALMQGLGMLQFHDDVRSDRLHIGLRADTPREDAAS